MEDLLGTRETETGEVEAHLAGMDPIAAAVARDGARHDPELSRRAL